MGIQLIEPNVEYYLNALLHHVVENKEHEDTLAGHDEVVGGSHITDELHSSERPGGNRTTSRRELNQQTVNQHIYIYTTRRGSHHQ